MNSCKETTVTLYKEFDEMPQFQGPNANMDLLQGIISFGFERPSEIQQQTIVPLFEGRNVIGQAQSGRGKTGAFVIGTLSLIDPKKKAVQAIIIANTHELARQNESVLRQIGGKMLSKGSIELCIGQQIAVGQNKRAIMNGAQILVGTPGRIKDLLSQTVRGKPLIRPADVKILIMDEADCLLMDKFKYDIADIIERLDSHRPDSLQMGIFSATFQDQSLEISRAMCVPDKRDNPNWQDSPNAPIEILIPDEELTLDGIEQYYYYIDCRQEEIFDFKTEFIITLNEEQVIPMCIIYVNQRPIADRLKNALDQHGLNSQCIYGNMSPTQRCAVVESFRRGETRLLITTDLLARGFDVQQVKLVINFDVPYVLDDEALPDPKRMAEYLHRIGRSGRFGRKGMAINLVASPSEMMRKEAIEEFYETVISPLPDDVTDLY